MLVCEVQMLEHLHTDTVTGKALTVSASANRRKER